MEMEDNPELFIDPEEDEVFFFSVTERESLVKSMLENKMQLETEKINGSCSNKNDHASKDIEGNIQSESSLSPVKTHVGFQQMTDLNWLSNSSNLLSIPIDNNLKNHENIADRCPVTDNYQESLETQAMEENIDSPRMQNTPEKKKLDQRNGLPSMVNVHIDHSYFIPMKNVIDKNILKTPKSIVKADKDGGFLKVLSEIALVKAEVDENNLGDGKKLNDISSVEELNDDDKENKQSDTEKVNAAIKQGDLSPAKVYHDLTVDKANNESQRRISCSFEKVNEEHLDFSAKYDLGSKKIAETVNEHFLGNEKPELECFNTGTILNHPTDELCWVKSLSLKEERSNDRNIAHEKPNDNVISSALIKERETIEKISDSHLLKEFDNFKGKTYEERITLKGSEDVEEICASENNFLEKESGISPVPELKLPTASADIDSEGKDDSCVLVKDIYSSERERHKKFLRRNTMRLLEELNELVTFGQAKRESLGTVCNTKLSEEAAKVIQKLKAVGFDDSICSPEQYFDLDKLDNSVFNSEISDILNDTLSKPLTHITSKDVESLLEKITTNSFEVESEIYTDDEFNSREENSNNVITNKNFINESEKFKTDQQKSPDFEAEKFENISKNETNRPKCGMPVQCESNKKLTEESNVLSGNKKIVQRSVLPPQAMHTEPKGFRSVERKYKGLTRIPKLVSTTSKIPITAKEVKQQLGYPAPNKTPFLKALKSLKFNNIDSTGKTNVNSKMPVTFSSGKGKIAAKDDILNTRVKSAAKKTTTRNLFPKSEIKLNSQLHKFKSAISLKENSAESHLTKFVPQVLKVPSGCSPVTSKYGGSTQSSVPKRP